MLFITNRFLVQGPTELNTDNTPINLPRQINFADDNRVDQSIYFCQRLGENNYQEIGGNSFFNELKQNDSEDILLYIHGFNTQPEGAFKIGEKLSNLCQQKSAKTNQVTVVTLIWPCGNQVGIIRDYFDDQQAADASAFAFMRLLEMFFAWRVKQDQLDTPCTKRINVLAHSMGNRVLRGAIKRVVRYYQQQGMPLIFRNVFMIAADVVNETLEQGQDGQYIPESARNVVVYYASDDFALRSSKVANVKNGIASRRLGHTGPENMDKVPRNVYAIDCDDFNNRYDNPLGHTYFLNSDEGENMSGVLFDHLWQCLDTGRVPNSDRRTNRNQILSL